MYDEDIRADILNHNEQTKQEQRGGVPAVLKTDTIKQSKDLEKILEAVATETWDHLLTVEAETTRHARAIRAILEQSK